jgi:hypothetical protein
MRKSLFPSLCLIIAFSMLSQVQAGPARPGQERVLKLIEVMRIPGEGPGYVLQGVSTLEIDRDGNLYTCDSFSSGQKSHLLKFSADGRFVKDLYRQGQGPGEIESMYDFKVAGSDLYLFDFMKRKVVVQDTEGKFKAEYKRPDWAFGDFLGTHGDWLVFSRKNYPLERKNTGLYDIKHSIVWLAKDGSVEKEGLVFSNREFLISMSQGGGIMAWDPFTAVIGDGRIYVNSTQEYQVQVLDLTTGKVIHTLKREYPRIKHVARDREKSFVSRFNAPTRKYENDIAGLFFGGGFLWIRTSSTSKDKGTLFDLFDADGRFADSFYINLKGSVIRIENGFLYGSLLDADDLPVLVKYRIDEPLGIR